jgi:hypothetical protein
MSVTVNSPATATLSGTQTILTGQSANLSVTLTGTSPWSVVVNGITYSNITASPYVIPVTPNSTTIYTLSSVSNSCGAVNVTTNNTATITVGTQNISPSFIGTTFCGGSNLSVAYTATGTYGAGNVFTVQLSSASGSFASPLSIGTLSSTSLTGTISATIPASNITGGTGYRIRVISSNPTITGSDNGTNLSVFGGVSEVSTVQAGDWSSTTTWQCGIIPDATKTIRLNHTVIIDGINASAKRVLYNGGKFNFINKGKIRLIQ